jgi:hypothetical protein
MEIMSGNLTKYQLLQHRHLSLLRALQDAGVEAKCNSHGDWTVAYMYDTPIAIPAATKHPTMDEWTRKNLLVGCNRALAPRQYWTRCGESDMGQTSPALCTNCGGNLLLADPGIRVATMPDGYEFSKQYKSSFSFDEFINGGWTIETMKEYRIIVPVEVEVPPPPMPGYEGFAMSLKLVSGTVHAKISGTDTEFAVDATPSLVDLINSLRGAIVTAPAKA